MKKQTDVKCYGSASEEKEKKNKEAKIIKILYAYQSLDNPQSFQLIYNSSQLKFTTLSDPSL